jgi:capsule polysaccharide export protein KpsC/LpsZ
MAHINWDSVSDYAPMLYESFNEWMIDTIDIAKEVSDVQWLIKVHPAEAWDNPESGVEALVRKEFPELPGNIKLLSAEENISPLDFFGLVDGAVTVYGTAGLELAMQGKPVILAGDAHYGNKGFTHDAVSRLTYQNLLRHAGSIGPLRESQIDLAKKYAYCYFILRQIPVSVVANPNSKWWSFQFDQRERLLPGNDPVIDFICERLLDGKDFVMSPELEFKANTYMNEKR